MLQVSSSSNSHLCVFADHRQRTINCCTPSHPLTPTLICGTNPARAATGQLNLIFVKNIPQGKSRAFKRTLLPVSSSHELLRKWMPHSAWWSHQSQFWFMSYIHFPIPLQICWGNINHHFQFIQFMPDELLEEWSHEFLTTLKIWRKIMYIHFIIFYWQGKLSLCSQQRNLTSAQMLALCAKAVFHAPALVNASQRTEERLMSALCSRSIFPFWLFARGEGNIMTFLTTPNYLDSLLPWEQRPLKNKTSAELLLLRGSQVIALDKSHLAHFSLSFLLSCTCSFPLINQKANTLPWILSECAQLSVRARGICQSWFCCFMYALCLFHLILEFHVLKIS